MLEITGLKKVFTTDSTMRTVALDGIDLKLEIGEVATVVGSNGAGKSTLLNAIAGIYPVDAGRIRINGVDVTGMPEHKRAALIGRVFQDPMEGTAGTMMIEENLAIALARGQRRGLTRGVSEQQRQLFRENLALLGLGLEHRLQERVRLLSGGQRQALTLLMATINRPQLLLLDEHTAALDPSTARQINDLTERIIEENNLTALVVTHNLEEALHFGDRTIMMHEGRIVLDVRGSEREAMTLDHLLDMFARVRGERLVEDRILLSS